MTDGPDLTKPWCYKVMETQFVEGSGYVPSVVVEGEPGHYPLGGRDDMAQPWFWGVTFDEAKAVCAKANEDLGRTPEECKRICDSSIVAQIRQDARRRSASERVGYR